MPERVYRLNYLLRTGHDEREHYKCAVSAESCAGAYERGWNHITRCVQTEHYRQIDYAGMSWDAHPRDMQDYCNAHYSEADSSMKIYSKKPHKSPDHRFMMSDAARNELMHMNWGGKIKVEIMASEMKDVMKLYPPDCFLELEWAEKAVSALEKNGDFEAAAYVKTLIGHVKEWDAQAIQDLHTLVKYGGIDRPDGHSLQLHGYFPPQSWNLDAGLLLYKPDGTEYNPALAQICDSFWDYLQEDNMRALTQLIENAADARLFQNFVGCAIQHAGGEEVERTLISRLQSLDSNNLGNLIYHYGAARDDNMLGEIRTKTGGFCSASAYQAMETCMRKDDFGTAGYLLRTKITTFNEVASFFDSHKKYSDTPKGHDDFMSRLQKYNHDVVLKTQGRDASPSVGKNL